MSKQDFQVIMQVSNILGGFKAMEDLLGEAPKVQLSNEGLKKWNELTKKHDEFYELDINDRLLFSEMGGRAKDNPS